MQMEKLRIDTNFNLSLIAEKYRRSSPNCSPYSVNASSSFAFLHNANIVVSYCRDNNVVQPCRATICVHTCSNPVGGNDSTSVVDGGS